MKKAAWDSSADWYDSLIGEHGSEYHQKIVLPGIIKLLSPLPGERILDVGCGQGVLCRLLAEKKVRSVGIDVSEQMILSAEKRSAGRDIRFIAGDAATVKLTDTFDAAALALCIQNMNDPAAVIGNISRYIRPEGRIAVAMLHPCFRIPRQSSWEYDESKKLQFRRIDRYLTPLEIPIFTNPGRDSSIQTITYHRPVGFYFNLLADCGLRITRVEEWTSHRESAGKRAKAENRARREFPLFMAVLAVKSKQ